MIRSGFSQVRLEVDTTYESSSFIGQREHEQRVTAGHGDVLFAIREE
jgi:hypothetical protein